LTGNLLIEAISTKKFESLSQALDGSYSDIPL